MGAVMTRPATLEDLRAGRPLKWKTAERLREAGSDPGTDYAFDAAPPLPCQSGVMVQVRGRGSRWSREEAAWWDLGWFVVEAAP